MVVDGHTMVCHEQSTDSTITQDVLPIKVSDILMDWVVQKTHRVRPSMRPTSQLTKVNWNQSRALTPAKAQRHGFLNVLLANLDLPALSPSHDSPCAWSSSSTT